MITFPSDMIKKKMLETAPDDETRKDIQVIIDIIDEMEQSWYRIEAKSRKLSPAIYAMWQEKIAKISNDWVDQIVGSLQ